MRFFLQLPVLHKVALRNNDTSTFVATNKWKLGWQWPIAVHGVEISVANTRILDVDEDLIWAWLLDWNLLELDGATGLLDDLRPLHIWNCHFGIGGWDIEQFGADGDLGVKYGCL